MSWPARLLNEANRNLQARIEHVGDDVQKRAADIDSQRGVVALLRENLAQVRRHIDSDERATSEEQERLREAENKLQELQREESHYRAEMQQLRRRHEEVCALLQSTTCVLQTKATALEDEQKLSEALERAALEMSMIHGSRKSVQETQEEVEKRQRRLQQVQASLVKVHNEVRTSQKVLLQEKEETARVQRELTALRYDIEKGKQDKAESLLAVSHVQQAVMVCESQTATNAKIYTDVKQLLEARRNVLMEMQEKLKKEKAQLKTVSNKTEECRRKQAKLMERFHSLSTETLQHENAAAAMQRQLASQLDVKRELTRSQNNALALRDERYIRLQELLLRSRELDSLMKESKTDNNLQSLRCLENTRVSLQRTLQQLDAQLHHMHKAMMDCFSNMQREGRVADELNNNIMKTKKSILAAERDYATEQQSREECLGHLQAIEERLLTAEQNLSQTRVVVREGNKHERDLMEGTVRDLRAELHRLTREGFVLRREITPLRCALNAHLKLLHDARANLTLLEDAALIRGKELTALQEDGACVVKEKQSALLKYSEVMFQLRSVRQVAESHLEMMRGVASVEDILRGQASVAQEAVLTDIKNSLVELHLEQKAQGELQTDLRRCQEQLRHLKSRYQTIMESMTRKLAPTGESGKEELHVESSNSSFPEVLHAKCILQSSLTREELQERGNHLDGRIVFLEHETRTLRNMLQAMQMGVGERHKTILETSNQKAAEQETLLLREGVLGNREALRAEVDKVNILLEQLQSRRRNLTQRQKEVNKRLVELRVLKANREVVLQRLRAQIRRTRQKQSHQKQYRREVFGF
ncbi:uncharacterized protein TM35_000491410 [Trypanosoma theileri]|uniref:Uncharacterized protein n=1 Tax=Trypanosoma theileri TaxID=67003 RepID=A0A1X0NHD9_9TRYP|nr:uncharacterized protein TM35_000491410 [Trypanosoma theileri]ORC84135.1 hypothetical protein TM35_000491410 [Trypanosoma theileri]